MKAANLPRCLRHVPPHPSSVRCLLGSSQDPGYLMTLWAICLAAYALSWWACASSRGVDASFASFGLFVPVFRAGGRIGHQICVHWRVEDSGLHHAWEGRWPVRQMDRCRLSRPLFRPRQAQLGANVNKTKLESINVTKHTVKGGRRNTRHATQLRQNKRRGHKAACNRSQHKQSFTHYPNRHQKQWRTDSPALDCRMQNNTCYMNSFIQALFLTDAFVWRIYDLHPEAESQAIQNWRGGLWVRKEGSGVASKAVCQNGMDKTQAYGHLGHPAGISRRLPFRWATGCDRDNSFHVWQTWWKRPSFAEGSLVQASCKRKFSVGSVGRSRFARRPLQIWCFRCALQSRPKRVASCQPCRSFWRSAWSVRRWTTQTIWSPVKIAKRRHSPWKWSEITQPPPHLCLCLNRFTFNMQTYDFTNEKTPMKIDEGLWIGSYEYELYHTIIHTGKDASSGHYYAMGRRSEPTVSGDCAFYTMDDSQIKEADVSLLAGNPPEKLLDDNTYVLFLRCKQAPPTPEFRIPLPLVEYVKKEDKKQWVEHGDSRCFTASYSLIFCEAPLVITLHSLEISIHVLSYGKIVILWEVSRAASKSTGELAHVPHKDWGGLPQWTQARVRIVDDGCWCPRFCTNRDHQVSSHFYNNFVIPNDHKWSQAGRHGWFWIRWSTSLVQYQH